jgi:hypothetical protein
LWNWKAKQFEFVDPVAVDTFSLQFLRKLDNTYRVEGAFLDTYSATRTEVFIDYRFLLSFNEFDRVSTVENFRTEPVAWYSAIVWFTVLLIERSYT